MDRSHENPTRPSPTLAAYAHAAQDCREIAQLAGIRNCDTDPEWRASEYEAEQRYDNARTAGLSAAEVSSAGRKV
ncbi:hypothetical protein OHB14_36600 [Streptomyces sp. NBC_01613]|uniref:hypothetical protein n=1 Tax=Streptomyces sp. NBC_01613 TaxID=2975896 RepID=UPI0038645BF9